VDEYSVRYPLNDHNKDVLFPTGFYRCSGMMMMMMMMMEMHMMMMMMMYDVMLYDDDDI